MIPPYIKIKQERRRSIGAIIKMLTTVLVSRQSVSRYNESFQGN